jgi:hypothetical protein
MKCVGVQIQYRNKSSTVATGGKIITATIKSRSESIKCEGVVDRLGGGVIHHEFVPCGQDSQWAVLLRGHEATDGGRVKEGV